MTGKTLSEKRMERVSGVYYYEEDIKKAIKRLDYKMSFSEDYKYFQRWVLKIFGEKLI